MLYIYTFHLTWPMSLHYLVKGGCSKFLPNSRYTGFVTIRLFRFGVKVKRIVATTFLLIGHCQTCAGCPWTIFLMFQRDGISAHQHATPSLSWSERDARNASSSSLGACVRVRGAHFEHQLWQFWAHLSWQLITLLNKLYSVYCVQLQSSDTLLQIIHFKVV